MFKLLCAFIVCVMFGCATTQKPVEPVKTLATTETEEPDTNTELNVQSFEEYLLSTIVKIRTTYSWCDTGEERTVDGFGFLATDNGLVFASDISVLDPDRNAEICNAIVTATLQDGRTSVIESIDTIKGSTASLFVFLFESELPTPFLETEIKFNPLVEGSLIFTISKEGELIRGVVGNVQPLEDAFVFNSSLVDAVPGFPIFNEYAEVIGITVLFKKPTNSKDSIALMLSSTFLFIREFGSEEGE